MEHRDKSREDNGTHKYEYQRECNTEKQVGDTMERTDTSTRDSGKRGQE